MKYFTSWVSDLLNLLKSKAEQAEDIAKNTSFTDRARAMGAAGAYREIHDYVDTSLRRLTFRPEEERKRSDDED